MRNRRDLKGPAALAACAAVLILAASALLVGGLMGGDGLGLIYLSIVLSCVAGVCFVAAVALLIVRLASRDRPTADSLPR